MFELLERDEVQSMVVREESIDYSDFDVEVSEKLGYSYLVEERVQKEKKSRENKEVVLQNEELIKVLKDLDIMPFTRQTLKKYKEYVAHNAIPKVVKVGENFCVAGAITLILGLVGCVVGDILFVHDVIGRDTFILCWVGVYSGIFIILCGWGIKGGRTFKVEWRKCLLSLYEKPVPEFVLQTALDIKERCSDALFFIEELYVEEVVKCDPFLIVQVNGGPAYYIEVWNEPKFKKERVV